jgi:hypothetical protein
MTLYYFRLVPVIISLMECDDYEPYKITFLHDYILRYVYFSSCSTADTELLAVKDSGLGTSRSFVGIILPSSPNTYAQITAKMNNQRNYKEGFFKFTTGDIYGTPVVLSSPPPVGSFSLTAIDTYLMEKTFDPAFCH